MNKIYKLLYKFWGLDENDFNKETIVFSDDLIVKEDLSFDESDLWFDSISYTADYSDIFSDEDDDDFSYVEVSKPNNKKQEVIDGLKYLKSKKTKTKQDLDSIYTLEMVLRTMK
jgi:hypothetical protein